MTTLLRRIVHFGLNEEPFFRSIESLGVLMKPPETNTFRLPLLVLSVLRADDQGRQLG